jgi:hypothetical protein
MKIETACQILDTLSFHSALLGFAGTTFAELALAQYTGAQAQSQTTPLASWNDGPAKQAVPDFVRATTNHAHHHAPASNDCTRARSPKRSPGAGHRGVDMAGAALRGQSGV